jgi:hypothetical protein
MDRIVNRPFFSLDVLVIAVLVILLALLVSGWLADGLYRLIF